MKLAKGWPVVVVKTGERGSSRSVKVKIA